MVKDLDLWHFPYKHYGPIIPCREVGKYCYGQFKDCFKWIVDASYDIEEVLSLKAITQNAMLP